MLYSRLQHYLHIKNNYKCHMHTNFRGNYFGLNCGKYLGFFKLLILNIELYSQVGFIAKTHIHTHPF